MKKLNEVVVQSGIGIYRNITSVFLFSSVSSLVLLPIVFFLPTGFALALLPLVYVPLLTGVLHASGGLLKDGRGKLKDVLRGAFRYYGASVVFGLIMALFVLIIGSSWWYYGQKAGTFYFSLAVFQTYFSVMVIFSQLYTLPVLLRDNGGIFRAMGKSVRLFVAHPAYSAGAVVQALLLAFLLGVTVVGFLCLFAGMMGIYIQLCTSNVLREDEENEQREQTAVSRSGY